MLTGQIGEGFYVFVTLLAMLNPIEAAAAFCTLTEGRSPAEQAQIAKRATLVAGIALISFAFVGEALLKVFLLGRVNQLGDDFLSAVRAA